MQDRMDVIWKYTQQLAKKVYDLQGCKATVLVTELAVDNPKIDWPSILQEAIRDKQVVEVEYILPELNYRIKSFILPKGTEVR